VRPFFLVLTGVAGILYLMDKSNTTAAGSGMTLSRAERIRLHRNIARIIAAKNGIPAFADWAVGQAGAESDFGNSHVYELTNNPFGIKAGSWISRFDAAGNPVMKAPGLRVVSVEAHDGRAYYRAFNTLEAAYQHLLEQYRNNVEIFRPAFPMLAAGQYAGFAAAVCPAYDPSRPATGPNSYAQLVLNNIKAAQAVA